MMDTAKTFQNLNRCAQLFERVSKACPGDWLPIYYNSLTLAKMTHLHLKKNDSSFLIDLGKAEKLARTADSLNPRNSENKLLMAYVFLLKIRLEGIDKKNYNEMSFKKLMTEAVSLNENNPRCYLVKGEYFLIDTLQFPSNKKNSLSEFESALKKYELFNPEKELFPNWGKKYVAEQIEFLSKH